jgi:hypothetical protein
MLMVLWYPDQQRVAQLGFYILVLSTKLHYGEFPLSRQRFEHYCSKIQKFRNSAGLKDHLVTLHFHKKL